MAVARATPSASRTLVWTTAANVALPVSAFITSPILARELGPHGRGEMAAVRPPSTLAVRVMTFGLPESRTYHVATRRLAAPAAARLALGLGAASGGGAGLAGALLDAGVP